MLQITLSFFYQGQHMLSDQIEVAWFKCEQLETLRFYMKRTFQWVVKCLQEAITELPNCRIITTSFH